ncbi:cytochrome P450 [Streptomyces adelaidensis]|uniref:cytochrome P450 n=1 Tax=Streptomyces adelaidensis TaxID=2796465 RepID=UPI00190778FA|nr:cytochrome P450 [Streptomyces adelaidensis]
MARTSPSRPTASRDTGTCPVDHTDYRVDRPVLWHYGHLDGGREQAAVAWNDSTPHGFWMVQRYDHVLEALQMPDAFGNEQVNAFDPSMALKLLPNMLDQPEHSKLRKVLNPYFSPAAVKRVEPMAHERAAALIDEVAQKGSCDFVAEFAIRYPTDLFLALLGLPTSDGEMFVPWVEGIFGGFFGADEQAARHSEESAANIMAYFADAVEDRARHPKDPRTDLVSRLLEARIDGELIPRADVLTICLTLMTAGLDTTRSGLGYLLYHLARFPDDRRRITREPELWPKAIEEALRLYGLIIGGNGRLVTRDIEFHGAPMKKGDMVWIGNTSANRDPRVYDNPDRFDPDRAGLNRHLAFGAGPHRCIGMHLARSEMAIALREWHRRIPDYRLADGEPLTERGGQLSLKSLPLEWDR